MPLPSKVEALPLSMTTSSVTSNHLLLDTLDKQNENAPPAVEITPDAVESLPEHAIQPCEWSGPEDPENPMNWSTAKKAYHSAIPSLYCFTVYVKNTLVRWSS